MVHLIISITFSVLLFFHFCGLNYARQRHPHEKSPLYQRLPNCTARNYEMHKKTKAKALLCPMFKDEEGFLTEWVAYHISQGIDHVYMFDDSSTDNSLQELEPWVKAGYVSVHNANSVAEGGLASHAGKNPFTQAMERKSVLERECKLWGIENGFSYFFSIDLDEYITPTQAGITAVDSFDKFVKETGRPILMMVKYNFQSTPHILEPVDMLTIEAYQTRMATPGRMNYYTTVARKVAMMINAPEGSDAAYFKHVGWNPSVSQHYTNKNVTPH